MKQSSLKTIKINTMNMEAFSPFEKKSSRDRRSITEQSKQFSPLFKKKRSCSQKSLKLSPIKQYETNLRLSCQSWLVYDLRKQCYKRGWRPNEIGEFNGLIRLLVLKIYINLRKQNSTYQEIEVRITPQFLKEEIERKRIQKLEKKKKQGLLLKQHKPRCFQENTLVKFEDIIYGLMMMPTEDILEYGIIFIGYLCYCSDEDIDPMKNSLSCCFISDVKHTFTYIEYFRQYVNRVIFPSLKMQKSNMDENVNFMSSVNDICKLYLSLENESFFHETISKQQHLYQIKCQIGFKFWENRTQKFVNKRLSLGKEYLFTISWKGKKNFSVICHNTDLNILTILEDCKFGMSSRDINAIENWVRGMRKPIVDARKTHTKLFPVLRIGKNEEDMQLIKKKLPIIRIQTMV